MDFENYLQEAAPKSVAATLREPLIPDIKLYEKQLVKLLNLLDDLSATGKRLDTGIRRAVGHYSPSDPDKYKMWLAYTTAGFVPGHIKKEIEDVLVSVLNRAKTVK